MSVQGQFGKPGRTIAQPLFPQMTDIVSGSTQPLKPCKRLRRISFSCCIQAVAAAVDHHWSSSACDCAGACGRALACGAGCGGTGLCAGAAIGRGGGADMGRGFCPAGLSEGLSETLSGVLATTRAIFSWMALSCSAVFALSRAICSWPALSCSIPCPRVARSRVIDWSNCVNSGEGPAAAGAAPSGAL